MFLQAVTVCINYADYLESIIANRHHFDRWLVITCGEDTETQRLCATHGIECRVSCVLRPNGSDFDAAYRKAPVINEALDLLEQTGWVLLLDSDVLLPRHFRQRLEALPLEKGCLYGAAGRKVCADRDAFDMIRGCEPWDRLLRRNSRAIGYLNLFHSQSAVNRYPTRTEWGGDHDDWRFTNCFESKQIRLLPMTVVHAGPIQKNWRVRVSEVFRSELGKSFFELPEEVIARIEEMSCAVAAIVGYFPGGRWLEIAKRFSKVFLVDQFQVHAKSGSAMLEADRTVLRRLWEEESAELQNLERLGPHSKESVAKIPDASIDFLYLPGEVAPDWMAPALSHWLPKLREGAIVCGDLFGMPSWRESTFTISLLLNVPDGVAPDGFWWTRYHPDTIRVKPACIAERECDRSDGVVVVNHGKESLESLLLSLHAVRKSWTGPLQVYHWGEHDESLQILCELLDADLRHVSAKAESNAPQNGNPEDGSHFEDLLTEAAKIQPFARGLILRPGMVPLAPIAPLLTGEKSSVIGGPRFPWLVTREGRVTSRRFLEFAEAKTYAARAQKPVLSFAGDPLSWTDSAWEIWSEMSSNFGLEFAAEVRLPKEVTVVAVISEDSIGDLQRNWVTWRFRQRNPIVLILMNCSADDLWLPGDIAPEKVISLSMRDRDDFRPLLETVGNACSTEWALLLPGIGILPGAEIQLPQPGAIALVHQMQDANEELQLTGNCFVSNPFMGLLRVSFLRSAARLTEASLPRTHRFPVFMRLLAESSLEQWQTFDATQVGWKATSECFYVSRNTLSAVHSNRLDSSEAGQTGRIASSIGA